MHHHIAGLLAEGHRHLLNHLVLRQHRFGGEVVKAPVEQAAGLDKAAHPGVAVLGFHQLRPQHHGDQLPVGPRRGGHQTVARRVGGAGLDALGAAVQISGGPPVGDQVVGAVQLPCLAHVGGRHGVGLGVADGHERVVLHGLLREQVDIPRGGVVVVVRKAGGIGKMGILAAQLLRPPVHVRHKGGNAAADGLAQNVAHLVGGHHQQAVQQLLHRQVLAGQNVGGAGVLRKPRHAVGAGGEGLIQPQLAPVDGLEHQQRRHHLGDAGGILLGVGVLVQQHGAGGAVHQQRGAGLNLDILHGIGGHRPKLGQQQGQQQKNGAKTAEFHNDFFSICAIISL